MFGTRAASLILVAGVQLLSGAPVGASDGWALTGSARAALVAGCANAPSCVAFARAGCDPVLARPEGVEISIARLPAGAAGGQGVISWEASAGPAPLAVLEQLGAGPEGCEVLEASQLPGTRYLSAAGNYGALDVTVLPEAAWVVVSASAAIDLRWTLAQRAP